MASRIAPRTRSTIAALAIAALALTGCTGGSGGSSGGDVNTVDSALSSKIDAAVENAMQLSGSSEAIVGVWGGDQAYTRAYGNDAIDSTARIRMAQTSQPVMCAAMLDLVASGELELDGKVADSLTRQVGIEDVTWRQLCNMTSGIADFKKPLAKIFTNNPARFWPEQELIAQALTQSPTKWPGLNTNQSDTNFVVLARAMRVHTRESMTDLMKKHVFDKAGMRSSYYPQLDTDTISDDAMTATSYAQKKGKPVCAAEPTTFENVSPSILSGAGATVSTVTDMKNFYESYLGGTFGGKQSSAITEVNPAKNPKRNKAGEPTTEIDTAGRQWALGMEKMGPLYGRAGAITGTISAAYHDPETDFTVVVALNNSSAGASFSKSFAFELASISAEAGLVSELPWSLADQTKALEKAAVCQ